MRKILIILIIICGVITSSTLYTYQNNDLSIARTLLGIISIHMNSNSLIEISENQYLSHKDIAQDSVVEYMKKNNWDFINYEDATFTFTKDEYNIFVRQESIGNNYLLHNISSPIKNTDNDINEKHLSLIATGDILMHNTLIWSGQQQNNYNFDHLFIEIKDIIQSGDYAFTSLESALAGSASGYTGYPLFNSPDQLATSLKNTGFDLISLSNNHILDRGLTGALRTMKVIAENDLKYVGANASLADSNEFLIEDIKGIKVAFLAYTYSTNGIPIPKNYPFLVNMLETQKVIKDIKTVRSKADLVVVIPHWGIEYSLKASAEQKDQASKFFEAGADIIMGSHPHVVQPSEFLKVNNKNKLLAYSMGNFIGDQRGIERNSGVIFKINIKKAVNAKQAEIESFEYIPTYSHRYYDNGKMMLRVVAIEETIKKIEQGKEKYLNSSNLPELKRSLENTRKQLEHN